MLEITEEVKIERLRQLRRVVDDAPNNLFWMTSFSTAAACGTAHCAAGWAAVDPWFQANTPILDVFRVSDGDVKTIFGFAHLTLDALAEIFGIDICDARALFAFDCGGTSHRDIDKEEVLANIDTLIEGDEIETYQAIIGARYEVDEGDDPDDEIDS
jgi:hypothetical protein